MRILFLFEYLWDDVLTSQERARWESEVQSMQVILLFLLIHFLPWDYSIWPKVCSGSEALTMRLFNLTRGMFREWGFWSASIRHLCKLHKNSVLHHSNFTLCNVYNLDTFQELFDNFCQPVGSLQAVQNSLEVPSQKIKSAILSFWSRGWPHLQFVQFRALNKVLTLSGLLLLSYLRKRGNVISYWIYHHPVTFALFWGNKFSQGSKALIWQTPMTST
jgi:hypothetical protein